VPKDTPLIFAVLDGESPKDWSPFGTRLPELMRETKEKAKLKGVRKALRDTYEIYVEPMLKSPAELLEADRLDTVAGVIMDALPGPNFPNDLDEKLDTFRTHVEKVLEATKSNPEAMCRRLGYEMWFITDNDTDRLSRYVQQAYDIASMLEATNVSHQLFSSKEALIDHTAFYLSNVYLKKSRGK
jgi:hypothetical protein